jgi:hypothetical protein
VALATAVGACEATWAEAIDIIQLIAAQPAITVSWFFIFPLSALLAFLPYPHPSPQKARLQDNNDAFQTTKLQHEQFARHIKLAT